MRLIAFIKGLFAKPNTNPYYWYILYKDGSVDGGLIDFSNIFYVASERVKSGRKDFQIVYRQSQ